MKLKMVLMLFVICMFYLKVYRIIFNTFNGYQKLKETFILDLHINILGFNFQFFSLFSTLFLVFKKKVIWKLFIIHLYIVSFLVKKKKQTVSWSNQVCNLIRLYLFILFNYPVKVAMKLVAMKF
jgi:hypothetical protein